MYAFLQSVPLPSESHTVEAVVVGVMIGVGKVWDHFKGKKRDTSRDGSFRHIEKAITEVGNEVRDLKAHVIGPDGENGLRGDVRELKTDVRGLLDRERRQHVRRAEDRDVVDP